MAAPEPFADMSDSSCNAGAVHTWHEVAVRRVAHVRQLSGVHLLCILTRLYRRGEFAGRLTATARKRTDGKKRVAGLSAKLSVKEAAQPLMRLLNWSRRKNYVRFKSFDDQDVVDAPLISKLDRRLIFLRTIARESLLV